MKNERTYNFKDEDELEAKIVLLGGLIIQKKTKKEITKKKFLSKNMKLIKKKNQNMFLPDTNVGKTSLVYR